MIARITFKAGEEYMLRLSALSAGSEEIAKKAIEAGADIVANQLRANVEALPEEKFHHLADGETFHGVSKSQKEDLLAPGCFGTTPVELGRDGWWNAKVGFAGYGRFPTKKHPKGVPNQLLARAIESGSSVRQKHPFVRPAVTATKEAAQAAMDKVIEEEIKKTMKG